MPKSAAPQSFYYIMYRTGGTDWCTWRRLNDRYGLEAARAKQDELMLVQSAEQLERIGMPYGWESGSVDWSNDEIKTEYDGRGLPWRTEHVKVRSRIDPRDPDIFRDHNCWKCQDGTRPGRCPTPDRPGNCGYPHARND